MTTEFKPGGRPTRPGLSVIISERRQLINLAYRLLGSLAEAEDAVQETYARWYAMSRPQRDAIASPGAWLTTWHPHLLNVLNSARVRRDVMWANGFPSRCRPAEWAIGRRAPPRPTGRPGHFGRVDQHGLLVVLESMTPAERWPFILPTSALRKGIRTTDGLALGAYRLSPRGVDRLRRAEQARQPRSRGPLQGGRVEMNATRSAGSSIRHDEEAMLSLVQSDPVGRVGRGGAARPMAHSAGSAAARNPFAHITFPATRAE